jgi:hypothetical protein
MNISFSHNYSKLHGQATARLLSIVRVHRSAMTEKFIDYDTMYPGGRYPLDGETYMVLTFLGCELIPFTTARLWNEEKHRDYSEAIGRDFDVRVKVSVSSEVVFVGHGVECSGGQTCTN